MSSATLSPSTMRPPSSQLLRRLADLLARLEPRPEAAERARSNLARDLLPRTAGEVPYLVVGIVGPNNAGKSALFNGLVGAAESPSLPTGGATKRLVGAAHPELVASLRAEPTLERFPLSDPGQGAARELAVHAPEDPSQLILLSVERLPPGLLLIDTPDFDSILESNRMASESLLAVADLALAVVTRHTYQNREVVQFLQRWLAHERPWMLVYNEAPSVEIAREHAQKLGEDVGSEPLAVFCAPHSLEVQEGTRPLAPERDGQGLDAFLFDHERVQAVKEQALGASLAQLHDDLTELAGVLEERVDLARDLIAAAEARAGALGQRLAATAMPGGPFIEAFRAVLDRRTNPISRGWRSGLRKLRLKLESLPSLWRLKRTGTAPAELERGLSAIEREELQRRWSSFWEELVRDLGSEARVPARGRAPEEWCRLFERDLAEAMADAAHARALEALAVEAVELEAFQRVCEELVEEAIEERGRDWDIQAAADVATLAPLAIAAAVILKTGGLGTDVGVAGGAAASSYLFEKYSHLLGSQITKDASARWARMRGEHLAPVLARATLRSALPALEDAVRAGEAFLAELDELQKELRP